jgi:hypothetical protein
MRKFIALGLLVASTANAEDINTYLQCTGTNNTKQKVELQWSPKNDTLIVNGDTFDVDVYFKGGTGLATINFISTEGVYVYDVVYVHNHKWYLAQHNAATYEIVSAVKLNCKTIN